MGLYKGSRNKEVLRLLWDTLPKFNQVPLAELLLCTLLGLNEIKMRVNEVMLETPARKPSAGCACLATPQMI